MNGKAKSSLSNDEVLTV